jgi:hypothetical protein
MSRVIPNEHTYVAFLTTVAAATLIPTGAEITAGLDVTPFLMGINASSTGNTVPTPSFDSLFETTIVGTSQATFSADFYRDDEDDVAWEALPRGTSGFFVISRFGGSGTDQKPIVGDTVETWPVEVNSRTAANMANNAVQTFTVTCSVNIEPNEAATLTA